MTSATSRWLAFALWLTAAFSLPAHAIGGSLQDQIDALHRALQAPDADSDLLPLRGQLLISLERRRDLARTQATDVQRLSTWLPSESADPNTPSRNRDALRRELQLLDAVWQGSQQRLTLLTDDREAAAQQLAALAGQLRQVSDSEGSSDTRTGLLARIAESTTAELDQLIDLVSAQQRALNNRREQVMATLAALPALAASEADATSLQAELDLRSANLAENLSRLTAERERVEAESNVPAEQSTPFSAAISKEQLAAADLGIELCREAIANIALERDIWRMALHFEKTHDAVTLVEARQYRPTLTARLTRRRDFLEELASTLLIRIEHATQRGPSIADDQYSALHAALALQLSRAQAGIQEQQRLLDLIARLRDDFEQRAMNMSWSDRLATASATAQIWIGQLWDLELFAVAETVDLQGRKTVVAKSITVGKIIKAPLLLLFGLFASRRVAAWLTLWLQRRSRLDDGRARLIQRWVYSVLAGICALASLALAGIPLAAFAFIGGAVAIGAGFGMQTLFKNLISGILILIERPFRLGDVIEVGSLRGAVMDIDLRASVIRDGDGAETLIPNSILVESQVKNITHRSSVLRHSLRIRVAAEADSRQVETLLEQIARRHGLVLKEPNPQVYLEAFDQHSQSFALHFWLAQHAFVDPRRIASDLQLMILGGLNEAQIRPAAA
ncbi:hypothetical protein C7S18_08195 [Ahniella affigens]|uniref:Mechanosensitive ion channel protein MscS n=1 Tax=Ahniella affigens TaxID=2021234 RepID=A0A2P1PQR0_9GAMM|nr:hypothetical protein C7S18_08195 [Ahniella affigens]